MLNGFITLNLTIFCVLFYHHRIITQLPPLPLAARPLANTALH